MRNSDKKEENRLFVAVDLPPGVVQEIARIQKIIKEETLFEGKFVEPQQAHLTIKFIGEVPTKQLAAIEKKLDKVKGQPLEAKLGSLDTFTTGSHIKIIFLSVVCSGLANFAKKIEQVLLPWCSMQKPSFINHVTLARVKHIESANKERLLGLLQKITVNPLQFTINSFVLKESVLSDQGATYIDKARYQLG